MITGIRSRSSHGTSPLLLSRRDVAERFGVSPQTVTRWAKLGILPHIRTLGGQRRYPADEIERLTTAARSSPARGSLRQQGGSAPE
ncbi:MAG: hypothetical protein Kow0010_07870 [Dehalococcoidia bacterium]